MKKTVVTLVLSLWMGTWAQEGNAQNFRDSFSYIFRVAEAPCPEQLQPTFPQAICYRHGYDDFFDFKEVIASLYMSGPDSYLEPWHVVTLRLAEGTVEGVRAHFRSPEGAGPITLTYVDETLLVLEVGGGTPAPSFSPPALLL